MYALMKTITTQTITTTKSGTRRQKMLVRVKALYFFITSKLKCQVVFWCHSGDDLSFFRFLVSSSLLSTPVRRTTAIHILGIAVTKAASII